MACPRAPATTRHGRRRPPVTHSPRPGGVRLRNGDHVETSAWITERTNLPDGTEPDSYWGSYARVCPPVGSRVAILAEVHEVTPRYR